MEVGKKSNGRWNFKIVEGSMNRGIFAQERSRNHNTTVEPTTSPSRLCPRFSHCSVNSCPLTESYPNHTVHPDDKYQVCTIEKQVRLRISAKFPGLLKMDGLKTQEFAARERYQKMSDAEKQALAERAKAMLRRQTRAV